ncbi:dTDP-4-deoxyrhamnose-3,5-epimerase [Cupriavidus taiwanensis]|uniref:dTDP-4-dehydrorhamnose 3,5-epimerase n=1 Tax=Cupriavidus taiwanensis TaxID=164546 RepID=UPI000E178BBD|nr:dTDP-4-dehydrorhamnose 3,5-epimerase [Cupriavidus taiwanensis]SOZ13915.1 dTDP-4-deoxyrhamnose-3,5-epimerase [Cupriavidus taiwanensis]SOZ25278.1 dTDP-4-deoxyrhamnose-3,5-epimerase [Cupriavidus taiwanensis]SOZ44529.1 dTDP-4-deoxyrhamnose-3,5-epimerase [Cupriavidus taiwanensis]
MKVVRTAIPDVLVLQPTIHRDARGFFFESYNQRAFAAVVGRDVAFVQDNHSQSARHVLRGLHYQIAHPQAKLVRVVRGEIFDVAVDLRSASPTFGKWVGHTLSEQNHEMMWVPEGFAHGFLVLSESAEVLYKTTDHHFPAAERVLRWDDEALGVAWPVRKGFILSDRDKAGCRLADAEVFS